MALQTTPARRTPAEDGSVIEAPDFGASEHHTSGDQNDRRTGPSLAKAVGWLMATIGFLIGSRVIADNSFFTHLATGNLILDNGSVPTEDVFSYTATGEPWTVQSWFASVFYRSIYEAAGLGGVRVANGLIVAALVATLWRLTERAKTLLPRVLLIGSALTIGAMMWSPRPLLFGLLCFALAIEVVENPRRPLWLMIPIMWLWVNTHGSFPLMVVFLGAVGVGQLIDDRSFRSRDLRAGLWLLGGIAVGALNPVGVKLLTFPFELLSKREALEDVSEWMAPRWDRPSEWVFVLLAFILLAAAKLGASWRHLLPAFGFFVTGLLAVRNINPAAVVMMVAAAPALSAVPGSLDGAAGGLVPRAIGALSAALFAVVGVFALITPGINYDSYPVLEVDWLEERGLVAQPEANLIHRDTTGNYLELRFGAEARVFMDDRYDMYPIEIIDDHAELYFGGDFEAILERYDATAILWESNGEFADWLRSEQTAWTVTMDGDDWIVAVPAEQVGV